MSSGTRTEMTRWTVAFAALAVIVLVYRDALHVNPTTVALTLVLYVLVLASQWELRYAVAVSFAAAAAYNYFFLPPLGTFVISDPQNWLALTAFLSTSVVGSRLSQRARGEAEKALRRQRELEVLHLLSRELLQTESVAATYAAVPKLINAATGADAVTLYLLNGDKLYSAGEPMAEGLIRLRAMAATMTDVQGAGRDVFVRLRTGEVSRGLLAIRGAGLTTESLEAIGGLVSLALDHAQAIEDAARSEASEESERLRTLILDSITHELRTPLTSIKGAAGALLAEPEVNAVDRRELVSIVDEEADRLNRLVGQAVDMARMEANEVQMHLERTDLAELMQEARESCAWVETGHTVTMLLDDLPEVMGDRDLLSKVICNLLENAAKYSAAGTPITISAEVKGNMVAVSVADHGIGIDATEQEFIFARLYRSRTQTEGVSGTGMGLAICRAIVQAHGGKLTVHSRLGEGSVFTFTLPLA